MLVIIFMHDRYRLIIIQNFQQLTKKFLRALEYKYQLRV